MPPGATPIFLSATVRRRTSSRPRQTAPMPPRPISASGVYLPAITLLPPLRPPPSPPHYGVPMEPVRPPGGRWARIVTVPTDSPQTEQSLLDDLVWRGLVAHSTDLDA